MGGAAGGNSETVILGIDPGTNVLGYGVVRGSGRSNLRLEVLGVLELSKYRDHYLRLKVIYQRVQQLVEQFLPDEVAIEAPFFGKNVQSMLKLGRAQGVAIAAVVAREVPIFEYAPRKIKVAITGNGAASKEQVAAMLRSILGERDFDQKHLDATDGLAAAVCHYYQRSAIGGGGHNDGGSGGHRRSKASSSWEEFVRNNPNRVR
ncbi:MAG: crossover junction endodeoxyribonuclease RuvC [Bacteroidales bacterium]|nr:crossover junction endodeoxyribonuclease RuvC [Bacteroidales bacterium]